MSKKKKSNEDIIADYYNKRRISQDVRSIKLDTNKYNKAILESDYMSKSDAVYEKFKIHRYYDRDSFIDHLASTMPNLSTSMADKMWKEYQHRDNLIISGQYEEWRYENYRKNYIKAMRSSGLSREAIKNVEALPMEKWKDIIIIPKADKDNVNDTLLPRLGGFHYGDASIKFIKSAIEQIKEAFSALGVKYVEFNKDNKEHKIAIAKVKEMNIDTLDTAIAIDNAIRIMPKVDRQDLEGVPFKDTASMIISIGENMPRNKVKVSKAGNRYIPFVGTTRQGSKNEKFMKALLEGYDIYQ